MVTMTQEAAIRADFAKVLGLREVPEPVWARVDSGDLQAIADAVDPRRRKLVRDTAALLESDLQFAAEMRAWEGGADGQGSARHRLPSRRSPVAEQYDLSEDGGGYETDRAGAFSAEIARLADQASTGGERAGYEKSRVRSFRDDALGNRLLTPDKVLDFVRSPAVSIASFGLFRHLAGQYATADLHVETDEYLYDDNGRRRRRVVLRHGSTGAIVYRAERPAPLPTFALPIGTVEYWPGSWLGELHRLAEWLSKYYPWAEAEAAWFVLTGEVPWVSPFHIVYQQRYGVGWRRATLTMAVEPWVPAETVKREYQRLQRRILNQDNRHPGKAFAVWRFAKEEERTRGKQVMLTHLHRSWKQTHPGDGLTISAFCRLSKRGQVFAGEMMRPRYHPLRKLDDTAEALNSTPISTPKPADNHGQSRTAGPRKPRRDEENGR